MKATQKSTSIFWNKKCVMFVPFYFSIETCRCPQRISSARLPLPPLVYGAGGGLEILPAMLSEAVTSCCGNCSGRHGLSQVDWDRDATNSSALKYDQNDLVTAMLAGTHLALPRFKDTTEVEGDDDAHVYTFVPLISAPNLAIFRRGLTKRQIGNAAAHLVQDSIWEQYPLLLISTLLTILAGIFFWILVSFYFVSDNNGDLIIT